MAKRVEYKLEIMHPDDPGFTLATLRLANPPGSFQRGDKIDIGQQYNAETHDFAEAVITEVWHTIYNFEEYVLHEIALETAWPPSNASARGNGRQQDSL